MCQIADGPVTAVGERDLILHGVTHDHAGQVHVAGVLHGDLVVDRVTYLHTGSRVSGLGDLQAGPLGGDGQVLGQVLVGLDLRAGGVEGLRRVIGFPANQGLAGLGDVHRHGQLHTAIRQLRHLVAGRLGVLPVAGQGTLPRAAVGNGGDLDRAVDYSVGRSILMIRNYRTYSRGLSLRT